MADDLPPRTQPAPDWDAIARYHAGESPADEARLVAGWLAANASDAAMLATLDDAVDRAVGADVPVAVAEPDVEAALRAVKARRDAELASTIGAAPTAPRDRSVLPFAPRPARLPHDEASPRAAQLRRTRVWWAAGGLAAAAALALLVRPAEIADQARGDSAPSVVVALPELAAGQTFSTAVGRRDSLRLSDGTRVVLAPGSRLTVAERFGEPAREVVLEGQALFTVTHDEERPFTVRAGEALVRDVGTVFEVRTDGAPAGGVTVAVTEGRVVMSLARDSARLAAGDDALPALDAGDRGGIGGGSSPWVARGVVEQGDVAWATTGTLGYRGATVVTVAADLRRWRGIELRVDDPALMARRLTATFTDESTEEMVRVIALALGATAVRSGDVVTLRLATPPAPAAR